MLFLSSLHDAAKNRAAYRDVRRAAKRAKLPTPEDFAAHVMSAAFSDGRPHTTIFYHLFDIAEAIYEAEGLTPDTIPKPPEFQNEIEAAHYRDTLARINRKLTDPAALRTAIEILAEAFRDFSAALPRSLLNTREEAQFSAPLYSLLKDVKNAVGWLLRPFMRAELERYSLFSPLTDTLVRNIRIASGGTPNTKADDCLAPHEHKGTDEEVINGYLADTPFRSIFALPAPFSIPKQARFEHHWIVAGTGHGKTQTLQSFIANDLESVAKDEATIVVIDSQGDLIRNIAGLKDFAEGGPLHGKLCLIDPTDVEYPVALNFFDIGLDRINRYSQLHRERLLNGAIELLEFTLGSLLAAEMTSKQATMFRYLLRAMFVIPNSTINTFRELLEPDGYDKYREHLEKLQGTAKAFFQSEFNTKEFEQTKRQVVRRIWGILENQTFERMFSHPKNKLDLFGELNSGKVVLINTAKELLKQNGTEIFGRFFIAAIAQATQERAIIAGAQRKPAFVYIDECQDYLDQNVSLILEQARKFNVGMILAHQYLGQLAPKLYDSFAANTSIKFAGGVSSQDARSFSKMLRCEPEFIEEQAKGHFAVSVRNHTDRAVSLGIPFGVLEAKERMTPEEARAARASMREKYAVHWQQVHPEESLVLAQEVLPLQPAEPSPPPSPPVPRRAQQPPPQPAQAPPEPRKAPPAVVVTPPSRERPESLPAPKKGDIVIKPSDKW